MKLHLTPSTASANPSALFGLSKTQIARPLGEVDLSLTINFNGDQEVEVPGSKRLGLPGGKATFGVRRGQLRFEFHNCGMLLEKRGLSKPFNISVPVEQTKTRASEIQATAALDTRNISAKASEGLSEKTNVEIFQVRQTGDENAPSWIFESCGDRPWLEGSLQEERLGMLRIKSRPCEMNANFTVRGEDIRITWGKFGLTQNIHRNKLAVIERAIALRYIKSLIEAAPICEGRWQHG